jgi:putative spermidine/putrescine transport system substrate-binding protein
MAGKDRIVRIGKLEIGRRRVLHLAGGATIALTAPAYWRKLSAQEKRIVIRDPGGPYAEGFTEAFHKPFKAATGIESVGVAGQHEPTSLIKGMVDTKSYTWDMALLSRAAHDQLVAEGAYLEPLNVDTPFIRSTPKQYVTPTFAGNNVFSAILAYRKDAFKDRKPPASWADFWNVKEFPGRRALRKHPFDTIEEALLADGVPSDKLYPLDFDRAFKSLDRIKKDIAVWWTGGAQTSQLLKTGEVDMCPTWNARAQAVIDEGAPVEIVWNQNIWSSEGWCIIKGTPKADMCREFIKFAVDPARQAAWTKYIAYGPTHPDAYKHIPEARAKALPTYPANQKGAVEVDNPFWSKHKDKITERMNAWLLS